MGKIKNFFTIKNGKMRDLGEATVGSIFSLGFGALFIVLPSRMKNSESKLNTALSIIMFISGILLLGLSIIIISNAWQKYKMENGLIKYALRIESINEPVMSTLVSLVAQEMEQRQLKRE